MATSTDRPEVARVHRALAFLALAWGIVQFFLAGYAAFGGSSFDAHARAGRS